MQAKQVILSIMRDKYKLLFAILLIFVSRLPFLSNGYGVEEDAWGMVLTARNIASTGMYEYSRLPGHPVPELVYAQMAHAGPFYFNLLTALLSTAGILFFMLALKKANIKNYILAGLAVAFTPVVYVASVNTMDYAWALSFFLVSFYLLIVKKPALAGLALGLAIGCRITSCLLLFPFLFLCKPDESGNRINRNTFLFIVSTVLMSLLLFLPVLNRYGFSFFDTYPVRYPEVAKVIYKFTIPVWGVIGLISILALLVSLMKRNNYLSFASDSDKIILLRIAVAVSIIHTALYFCLPQKAAFMIPAIPFVLLIFAVTLNPKQMTILTLSLLLSCFFFGINLHDPYRGGKASSLSIPFHAGRATAVFDPLAGTVTDDYLKRKQRIAYSQKIISMTDTINDNMAVIAGWWLGDILVQQDPKPGRKAVFYYYADESTLQNLQERGYKIYFLPEQDYYNDERAGAQITGKYAQQLPF